MTLDWVTIYLALSGHLSNMQKFQRENPVRGMVPVLANLRAQLDYATARANEQYDLEVAMDDLEYADTPKPRSAA
jgi:hypothetical protein